MNVRKSIEATALKVAGNVVFGYGIVSERKGSGGEFEPYVDLQDDFIPEDVMLEGAKAFMEGARVAKAMHQGEQVGEVIFALPLTHDVAKGLGITEYKQTGLILGMRVDEEDVLANFKSGEYTGFSLGGRLEREAMNA